MHNEQSLLILKALADPTRLKLIKQLANCPKSEKSCESLSNKVDLSQPAMSHHFAKLVSAGVVLEQKIGTQKHYKLNFELIQKHGIDVTKL